MVAERDENESVEVVVGLRSESDLGRSLQEGETWKCNVEIRG